MNKKRDMQRAVCLSHQEAIALAFILDAAEENLSAALTPRFYEVMESIQSKVNLYLRLVATEKANGSTS